MINYYIMIMGTKPGTKKADVQETKANRRLKLHEDSEDFAGVVGPLIS